VVATITIWLGQLWSPTGQAAGWAADARCGQAGSTSASLFWLALVARHRNSVRNFRGRAPAGRVAAVGANPVAAGMLGHARWAHHDTRLRGRRCLLRDGRVSSLRVLVTLPNAECGCDVPAHNDYRRRHPPVRRSPAGHRRSVRWSLQPCCCRHSIRCLRCRTSSAGTINVVQGGTARCRRLVETRWPRSDRAASVSSGASTGALRSAR